MSAVVLDLTVLSTVVVAGFRGWRRGSIKETFALLGFIAGIVLVLVLCRPLGALLARTSLKEDPARAIAATILFLVGTGAGLVTGIRAARGVILPGPRTFDRLGGAVLGLVRALLLVALALYVVDTAWGPGSNGHRLIAGSISGSVLAANDGPFVAAYDTVADSTGALDAVESYARRDRVTSGEGYARTSNFQATDALLTPRPGAEKEMLKLVNTERGRVGLPALGWCERCAEVGRAHSKDMYRNGYFSHVDPAGNDPFDRMKQANIDYTAAGENLALAPTVAEAHEGLMKSPDHRANILREEFDQIGIGIFEGPYGLMFTQVFRAAP